MSRIPRALVPALLFAAISVNAAGLPDTGQDTCYNETAADGAPEPVDDDPTVANDSAPIAAARKRPQATRKPEPRR